MGKSTTYEITYRKYAPLTFKYFYLNSTLKFRITILIMYFKKLLSCCLKIQKHNQKTDSKSVQNNSCLYFENQNVCIYHLILNEIITNKYLR